MKLTDAQKGLIAKLQNGEFFTSYGLTDVTYRRENRSILKPYNAEELYIERKPSIKQLETLVLKGALCKSFCIKELGAGRGQYTVYMLNPLFAE
jgi:hypothetical protein